MGELPATSTNRRVFLTGASAAAAAAIGGACTARSATSESDKAEQGAAETAGTRIPFRSKFQQGVLAAPAAAGLVASFDVVVESVDELTSALQTVSVEIERLMTGTEIVVAEDDAIRPPEDSGIVIGHQQPASLAITLGVGASLFDQRFGLADQRPSELISMPLFRNDRFVRPEFSHGDLAFIISATSPQVATHALHQVIRAAGSNLRLRWVQEGFNDLQPPVEASQARSRNLLGFRDGVSNLDTANEQEMNDHVWIGSDDAEPDWTAGGTYLAVRTIRMLIEFWSTTALVRQELIFGRHRQSGAPLGQETESEEPAFASDPTDEGVPVRSHMRLANPRTPDTGRILRRGFSYLNGADEAGTLDQGLLFLAFQRSLDRGFLAAQARLEGEALEEYIKPVGGGIFFVVPGPGTDGGWLGQALFSA